MYSIDNFIPGQFWVLQFSSSLVRPVQVPPFFSGTDLDLVLYFVPPPQVLVQDENEFQLPHSQFTEIKRVFTRKSQFTNEVINT